MLHFLHIPRTGGIARWHALQPAINAGHAVAYGWNHEATLADVKPEDTPVVFLRDPVARFVSAYDQLDGQNMAFVRRREDGKREVTIDYTMGNSVLVVEAMADAALIPFYETWPTAEAFAWDIEDAYPVATLQNVAFMYQTTWVDAERPDTIWARTETMDEEFPRICDEHGVPHLALPDAQDIERRNNASRSVLSRKAMQRVRDWYERDEALIARHAPRAGIPSLEEMASAKTKRRGHAPTRAVGPLPDLHFTGEIRYRCQVTGGCRHRSMLPDEVWWSDGATTLEPGNMPPPPPNDFRPYCTDHVPSRRD